MTILTLVSGCGNAYPETARATELVARAGTEGVSLTDEGGVAAAAVPDHEPVGLTAMLV
jgi:hypothetical protein